MKTNLKLFRVDLNLNYLVLTEDPKYCVEDVVNWIKNDCHEGELGNVKITKVNSKSEVEDFEGNYDCYFKDGEEHAIQCLDDVIEELGLDAQILIDRLKQLGYVVKKK